MQLEMVQWMLSSDPTKRPSAEDVATSEILKQIKCRVQTTPDQDSLSKLTQGHALPLSSRAFCNPIDEYLTSALRGPYNCGYGVVVIIVLHCHEYLTALGVFVQGFNLRINFRLPWLPFMKLHSLFNLASKS